MSFEGPLDLGTVDRVAARAHKSLERELARFATEDGRGQARAGDPFAGAREVTVQSTFKSLRELEPGPLHAAHRDALVRWVHELLQARVAWDLLVDEADAVHAPDPKLSPNHARSLEEQPIGALGLATTFDEARRALVEAPQAAAADVALRRLGELARPIAAVRKELRARRFEVARRLGLDHPWALAASGGAGKLGELARAILDATEPLAVELHRDLRRRTGAAVSPAHAIHDAFATDVREGWPAHLTTRWFEDVFRAIAARPPGDVTLPSAIGGASFLRAAAAWGAALRLGGIARTLPFALARDPYPADAHCVGGALAIAVADRVFARRKLGLPARSADAHARGLARALFHALRRAAVDVLNGIDDPARADALEELGSRLYGAPLPEALGAAWSAGGFAAAARVDAPARLLGAVRAHALVRSLVERFDEDWFENPRVGAHLAGMSVGPIWTADLPEETAASAIARAFEEALG